MKKKEWNMRKVKMASALFSMLFLETAMFAQFGADMLAEEKQVMIMVTGAGISVIAYPAFNRVLKKEREKIAPEILRLTEELMK